MLDRHAVQALLAAGVRPRQAARQFWVSRRTIERIAREAAVETGDEAAARRARGVGRPRVEGTVRARVAALLVEDATLPPGELWRRLKEEGTPLGLSTVYRVLAAVRQTLPAELLVRFEGVAGEYAQFDFGEVSV